LVGDRVCPCGIAGEFIYHDVIAIRYVEDYKLHLTFENGRSGVVDFLKYIHKGGIFAPLKEPYFFKQFTINGELGVITWGDTVDVAPEILYAEATQEPLPPWMSEAEKVKKSA
jgi:hypothetical protein